MKRRGENKRAARDRSAAGTHPALSSEHLPRIAISANEGGKLERVKEKTEVSGNSRSLVAVLACLT